MGDQLTIDIDRYMMVLGAVMGNSVEYSLHDRKQEPMRMKFGRLNNQYDKPLLLILTDQINISSEYYNPVYAVAATFLEGRKAYTGMCFWLKILMLSTWILYLFMRFVS